MTRGLLIAAIVGLAAVCGEAAAKPPVVVELFTAQGCSSCGRASADLSRLADEKGVLALTFAVDYWDYLGWKDTFAKPAYTERQKSYAKRLGIADVYTPQVVVDGRLQSPAVKADDVEALVRDARRSPIEQPLRSARPNRRSEGWRQSRSGRGRAQRRRAAGTARPVARTTGAADHATRPIGWAQERRAGAGERRRQDPRRARFGHGAREGHSREIGAHQRLQKPPRSEGG
jgi:hypothetical protein